MRIVLTTPDIFLAQRSSRQYHKANPKVITTFIAPDTLSININNMFSSQPSLGLLQFSQYHQEKCLSPAALPRLSRCVLATESPTINKPLCKVSENHHHLFSPSNKQTDASCFQAQQAASQNRTSNTRVGTLALLSFKIAGKRVRVLPHNTRSRLHRYKQLRTAH